MLRAHLSGHDAFDIHTRLAALPMTRRDRLAMRSNNRLEVHIELHLEPITRHNLILFRLQLRHIPRTVHIPAIEPLALLRGQPDDGVRRQLVGLGEDSSQSGRKIIRVAHNVVHDVTRVYRYRCNALWAMLSCDELGHAEDGELGGLVGGDAW